MNENSLDTYKINNLQELPTTIYYLGALFTAGLIVGSIVGIEITKEK